MSAPVLRTSLSAIDGRCFDSAVCGVRQSREISKYKLTCVQMVGRWRKCLTELQLKWFSFVVWVFLIPWEWKAKPWVFSCKPWTNACFFDKIRRPEISNICLYHSVLWNTHLLPWFKAGLYACTFHCTWGFGAVLCCMWWSLSVFLKSS